MFLIHSEVPCKDLPIWPLRSASAITHVILELSLIFDAAWVEYRAFALLFILFEPAVEDRAVPQSCDTSTVFHVVSPFTDVDITVRPDEFTLPASLIVFELADVLLAAGPGELAFPVHLAMLKPSRILSTVGHHQLPLSTEVSFFEISFVLLP